MSPASPVRALCRDGGAGTGVLGWGVTPRTPPHPAGVRSRLAMVRHGMGSFLVFVGLRGSAAELALPATNFWIYPHNDLDAM